MWLLSHNWESCVDEPPPASDLMIEDAEQLRTALQAKAAGEPYYYTLQSPDKERLSLWLGGPWGAISRLWQTTQGRSFRTAKPRVAQTQTEVLFHDGREGCLMGPKDLISAAEVIDAAVYFFKHGELSPQLCWVGWDA
jgi:hypothetical protein